MSAPRSRVVDDGPGHAEVLVCPYHRWAFRPDGSLVGAPFADGTDLDGACLVALRHVVWNGFVLVNPSGDAPEPFDDLAGLDEHLAPWRWDELVTVATRTFESEWNWKVMVENWIECYHHLGAHRETVEPFWPASAVHLLGTGRGALGRDDGGGRRGHGWRGRLVDPGHRRRRRRVTSRSGRCSRSSSPAAPPTTRSGCRSNRSPWITTASRGTCSRTRTGCREAAAIDALMDEITVVHVEDMKSCRDVQAGLASGRIASFRLTPLEAPVGDFQRWVAGKLGRTV